MRYILSLDEGTSSARAALYDERGRRVAMEANGFPSSYPHPGWVEQDPEAIWNAQLDAARRVIASARVAPEQIAAIGITNQRETTVLWDRHTGRPIAPAIVWQCRRTADRCQSLASSADGAEITAKTGLVVDAYFSASKIEWILQHVPPGDYLFGTTDTWLIWKLTGGAAHVTDPTNASRTMLMDLATGAWDPDLQKIFNIPDSLLPRIVPSSGVCGVARAEFLGAEIPIAGIAGDQQAALFGQACFRPGLTKNTYGTGCFALMHTGAQRPFSANRLLATRAASSDSNGQFAVEGSVFMAGATIQWLRDGLGLIPTAGESEALARSVPDTGGVYFVPAFVGLGAPYWDSSARGLITGITRGTTRAHVVRAGLESLAFQTLDLIEAMEADSGEELRELRVDGGAAANDFLMQFQADILGKPILRPADTETTALGAAYLAGLASGVFSSVSSLENLWKLERRFEPVMDVVIRQRLCNEWRQAVARSRTGE